MKNSEIEVGCVYRAKVSGKFTDVRVDEINTSPARVVAGRYGSFKVRKRFSIAATNLSTGRQVSFKSGVVPESGYGTRYVESGEPVREFTLEI